MTDSPIRLAASSVDWLTTEAPPDDAATIVAVAAVDDGSDRVRVARLMTMACLVRLGLDMQVRPPAAGAWQSPPYSFKPHSISTSSQVGSPVKTSLKRR